MSRATTALTTGVVLAALGFTPALARAAAAVDWERRAIQCSGTAAPSLREETENVAVTRVRTEGAARREALQACVDAIRGIVISGSDTAGLLLDRDATLAEAVREVVRSSRRLDAPRFYSDGGAWVQVAVPLDGRLSELLLERAQASGPKGGGQASPLAAETITGVIVDARGVTLLPALAPRIVGEDGAEVYGLASLTPAARQDGGAAYDRTLEVEKTTRVRRLGSAPRLVKAVGARGADVIVSAKDAAALRGQKCLSDGKVVIVRSP